MTGHARRDLVGCSKTRTQSVPAGAVNKPLYYWFEMESVGSDDAVLNNGDGAERALYIRC